MRLPSGSFWGIFLILVGSVYILKSYFNFNIPMFRIIIGLLFIALGLSFMFGSFDYPRDKMLIFESGNLNPAKSDEYSIIFSNGIVDLTSLEIASRPVTLKINTIFASSTIRLPDQIPAIVKSSSVFASAEFPDGTSIPFGEYTYRTSSYDPESAHLKIEVNTVFGSMRIRP